MAFVESQIELAAALGGHIIVETGRQGIQSLKQSRNPAQVGMFQGQIPRSALGQHLPDLLSLLLFTLPGFGHLLPEVVGIEDEPVKQESRFNVGATALALVPADSNGCKRSERTYLAPVPQVDSLHQLASKLFDDCRSDLARPGPQIHGDKTVGQLLEEEKPCFLPLPAERFAACVRRCTFVDSHALVRIDSVRYSVPVEWAYHACVIESFVDQVRITCAGQVVAAHGRCYTAGQFVLDPRHYLRLLEQKPGSLDNARPFQGQPWPDSFVHMRKELEYRYPLDGTRRYIQILLLFTKYPPEPVQAAVDLCVQRRAFSAEAVLQALRQEPLTVGKRLDLSDRPELFQQDTGARPAGIYDQLKSHEEVLV